MKLFDKKTEDFEVMVWELGESKETLSIEEITTLAKTGLTTCPEHCLSRARSGEDRCECVRARFPTPYHYNLYKKCQEQLRTLLDYELLALAAKDAMEEKNNGKAN